MIRLTMSAVIAKMNTLFATLNIPHYTSFSALPDPATLPDGTQVFVSDTYLPKTIYTAIGGYWRTPGNSLFIAKYADDTGITVSGSSETVLVAIPIPDHCLSIGSILAITVAYVYKSGSAEVSTFKYRLGTTGTVADALLTTQAATTMSAATRVANVTGSISHVVVDDTHVRQLAVQTSTATQVAADAISSISAGGQYLVITVSNPGESTTMKRLNVVISER